MSRGLELAPQGWHVSPLSRFGSWEGHVQQGRPAYNQEGCGRGSEEGRGMPWCPRGGSWGTDPALRCAFLLEICSWSWRGLWARVAVPTGNKRVPETVKRALAQESGDLGLIFVPPMTHFVASWLSPDSTQTARVPVPTLVLTSGIPEPATPPSRPDFPCLQNGGYRGPHLPGVC